MLQRTTQQDPFAEALNRSIQDMRNSLGLLIEAIETPAKQGPATHPQQSLLCYETARLNNNLNQLQHLYALHKGQLQANVQEQYVLDFLEERRAQHQPLLDSRGITLNICCDDNLIAYFDPALLECIVSACLLSCVHYTREQVQLSASEQDGYLVMTLEDDSNGYPPALIQQANSEDTLSDKSAAIAAQGVLLWKQLLALHKQEDKQGRLSMDNQSRFDGGRVRVYLP